LEKKYLKTFIIKVFLQLCLLHAIAEDIKLNSTVFHWPDSLNTVFDVNQSRLTNRRERAEEDLRKKIAAFEEKLLEHNKEIETFRKKEVTAHKIHLIIFSSCY